MAAEETPTPPAQLTSPPEPILLSGPGPDQHQLPAPKPSEPQNGPVGEPNKPEEKKPAPKGRLGMVALVTAIVLAVLLVLGLLPRLSRNKEVKADAKKETQANALPTVTTISVKLPPPFDDLLLPGNIQAVQQTAVVARSSGYLKRSYVDIGDKVHAGQLLATIATPDLDQQVAQARAQVSQAQAAVSQAQANLGQQQANLAQGQANLSRAQAQYEQARTDLARARAALAQAQEASAQQDAQLAQAQANLNLARVTAQRYRNLLAEGAIDQQTTDQSVAAEQTNTANVQALGASLRASKANTRAFSAAVESSQANVSAYADGIRAGRAAVGAAAANVSSARAAIEAAIANVRSARANLARTQDLQGFQNVYAPFSGIITARNVDTGALIATSGSPSGGSSDTSGVGSSSAGTSSLGNAAGGSAVGGGSSPGTTSSGSAQSQSLFSIAQLGTLRIYLNVPQTYLGVVGVGQPAKITVREMPQTFTGTVTRSAGAFDAASRTLVTEVRLLNPDGALKPGMFADVRLRVPHPGSAVIIPGTALITNAGGTQVAEVNDGKVHFQPITVGRDFGETIEVTQGLRAEQQIVASPSDSLREGQKVKTAKAKLPSAKGGA